MTQAKEFIIKLIDKFEYELSIRNKSLEEQYEYFLYKHPNFYRNTSAEWKSNITH